jgi:hypothetical protein
MSSRTPWVVVLKQADIMKCPFVIMMPEHYLMDGSCRCTDENHLKMREWGYTWNPTTKRWTDQGDDNAA